MSTTTPTGPFTPGTPFDAITDINIINSSTITLQAPSSRPLPPIVTANNTTDSNTGRVTTYISCILLISTDNSPSDGSMPNLTPYYLVTDTNKLFIYISETAGNAKSFTPSTTFNAYHLEFSISPNDVANLDNNYNKIEVIHWDADPEGSRGTEINVAD